MGFLAKKNLKKIHFGTSSEAVGSSIYAVVHTWPGDHMRSVEENSVVREWKKLCKIERQSLVKSTSVSEWFCFVE